MGRHLGVILFHGGGCRRLHPVGVLAVLARAVAVAHAHPHDELVATLRRVQLDQPVHARLGEANDLLLGVVKLTSETKLGVRCQCLGCLSGSTSLPERAEQSSARGAIRGDRALALWRSQAFD